MGSDDGNFKAIGMPILLIVTFMLSIAITHQSLRRAFYQSRSNLLNFLVFIGSLVASLVSIFLYFSAAWAYGMICTVMCYLFALVISSPERAKHGRLLFGSVAAWFAFLIGIPSGISAGVLTSCSNTACQAFYLSKADSMCKEGWLDFVEIVAICLVSVTFLTLLTLMAAALEGDRPGEASYSAVGEAPQPRGDISGFGSQHASPKNSEYTGLA